MKKIFIIYSLIFLHNLNALDSKKQKEVNASFVNAAQFGMGTALEKAYKNGAQLYATQPDILGIPKTALDYAIDNNNKEMIFQIINFDPNVMFGNLHSFQEHLFYNPLVTVTKNVFKGKLDIKLFHEILNSFPFNINSLLGSYVVAVQKIFPPDVDLKRNENEYAKDVNTAMEIIKLLLEKEKATIPNYQGNSLLLDRAINKKTLLQYILPDKYELIYLVLKIISKLKLNNPEYSIIPLTALVKRVVDKKLDIAFIEFILNEIDFEDKSIVNTILYLINSKNEKINEQVKDNLIKLLLNKEGILKECLKIISKMKEDSFKEINFISKYFDEYLVLNDPELDKIIDGFENISNKNLLTKLINEAKARRNLRVNSALQNVFPREITQIINMY